MNTQQVVENSEDFENLTTTLDGSLIPIPSTVCSRCLYPLLTHAEITRRLHWCCNLAD